LTQHGRQTERAEPGVSVHPDQGINVWFWRISARCSKDWKWPVADLQRVGSEKTFQGDRVVNSDISVPFNLRRVGNSGLLRGVARSTA
jgi:hypothetical protein